MDDRPSRIALPETGAPSRISPAPRRSRLKAFLVGILILLAIGAAAWYLTPSSTQTGKAGRFNPNAPMPVVGKAAATGDMPVVLTGLGTVTPLATVTVKTQINGYLAKIDFQEGQMVKAGDLLAEIDPRPYQVALEQAEGTLARDQALLADAKLDLVRYQKLVAQDSIAEQQRDTQAALVKQDEGTVKFDQGQVDSAKLNLTYCHIVAPVAGRVGLRQVDQGNYVTSGDANGIVVVTTLQPITVVFTLPEDSIPPLMQQTHQGVTLPVAAWDRAHVHKLADGTLVSVDNQIDTTTGTFKLKAIFPNADETLFPNQFVNAELLLTTEKNAILVPQSAVQRGAPGTFVYLIDPASDTVSVRTITLGAGDANNIVVEKGLAAGDMVVIDGADKLKDGAKITLPNAEGSGGHAGTAAQKSGDGQSQGQAEHHHRRQDSGKGQQGEPSGSSQPSAQ